MRVPSDLTSDELANLLSEWGHGSKPLAQIAREFDLNSATLPGVFAKHGIKRVGNASAPGDDWSSEEYDLQSQHDREVTHLKARVRHLDRLYHSAVSQHAVQDILVSAMEDAIVAWPAPSLEVWPVVRKTSGTHTMVSLISDLHVGEVVDPEAMMGMGGYDLNIFRQRAGLWVRHFLRLLDINRTAREIPKLTVFLDGDFVSGLIHDELLKTNAVNVMEQMTLAATVMAWAIREVGRHFEEVHISCTPGNHGRTQQKVEYKDPSLSWDYMTYQMMAMLLKNDTHITWDISKSLWAITKVENLDLFHYHGHGKNSNSLSIPYYGIDRAVREFREIFQIHDLSFDGLCMGHFHHFFERDLGTGPLIINPCWKGGDEFATLGLRKFAKPAQTIFMVHNKRGYVGSQLIHLWGNKPSDADGVPKGPAAVWSDTEL